METLEDICGGSKYHPEVNMRYARYKIRDHIKRRQAEWKGELLSTRNIGKALYKVFKTVVNDISQVLPILGESGSEVSYFIPDPRNFSEVNRLSDDINKPWLKENLKEIKEIINNQNLLFQEPEKGEPVTPHMDV